MPTQLHIAEDIAMALLVGLLIGIEREHSQTEAEPHFAGIRTFTVITLLGVVAGLCARAGYPAVLAVALLGVVALAVAAYISKAQSAHKGVTTEFVAIIAFLLGALMAFDYLIPAATVGIITTLILTLKAPLHLLADRIQKEEIYAILKFAIVTVIVLPLLPDRGMGPLQVLNPRTVWWFVVLVSAISMVGYVLIRFMGVRRGIALTGFLGGLASSTVSTVSLAHEAKREAAAARYFGLGILIASTTMFFRILVLVFVIDPTLGWRLVLAVAIPGLVGVAIAVVLWRKKEEQTATQPPVENPMDLERAIKFALFLAFIMVVSRLAYQRFGSAGIYLASALDGLADVDAITVSVTRLAHDRVMAAHTANASILLAAAMNTLVKGIIAAWIGGRALRGVITPIFAALLVAALAAFLVVAYS
ncbi:MAG TPA: MgtC/SapB family protein [Terriglobia bacterium]|nr:MgtC/SapB family protein [Terriglobia bacterium]